VRLKRKGPPAGAAQELRASLSAVVEETPTRLMTGRRSPEGRARPAGKAPRRYKRLLSRAGAQPRTARKLAETLSVTVRDLRSEG